MKDTKCRAWVSDRRIFSGLSAVDRRGAVLQALGGIDGLPGMSDPYDGAGLLQITQPGINFAGVILNQLFEISSTCIILPIDLVVVAGPILPDRRGA
jgi:hypothetical protein